MERSGTACVGGGKGKIVIGKWLFENGFFGIGGLLGIEQWLEMGKCRRLRLYIITYYEVEKKQLLLTYPPKVYKLSKACYQ